METGIDVSQECKSLRPRLVLPRYRRGMAEKGRLAGPRTVVSASRRAWWSDRIFASPGVFHRFALELRAERVHLLKVCTVGTAMNHGDLAAWRGNS